MLIQLIGNQNGLLMLVLHEQILSGLNMYRVKMRKRRIGKFTGSLLIFSLLVATHSEMNRLLWLCCRKAADE